ncbi:hypothetical protein SETIT_1G136400v2 [Setaria italica]|uniref:Uncharacterized protein n=1 Tax=Setaria italica TaxID=4555 RepID=A0A368PKT5_SETIT|nr:hypothetical protein SETIT_1G136400v2 [Setaria italica]
MLQLETDQNYPSHHPSEEGSPQGAECTNDVAKVHNPLSVLAQHEHWQLLVPRLPIPIYHAPRSLLSPPSFTISYHISSINLLNSSYNCSHFHVGLFLQYSHQPLRNEGRC